jgi:hypothetical protein
MDEKTPSAVLKVLMCGRSAGMADGVVLWLATILKM